MPQVTIYTTGYCPYCHGAKRFLDERKVDYDEIRVDKQRDKREEMEQRAGRHTVPQIFFDDDHVGGYDDLMARFEAGELDKLLAQSTAQ